MQSTGTSTREEYVRLKEHNRLQLVIFILFGALGATAFFLFVAMPVLEWFFEVFLKGSIVRANDWSDYVSWSVLVSTGHGIESNYELNPLLCFFPICVSFGLFIAFYASALISHRYGLVFQKIQREIVNQLDKVARIVYHENVESEHSQLEQELLHMDNRRLHQLAADHQIHYDELHTLKRALRWRRLSGWRKVLSVQDGIGLYMRHYFTLEYGNGMLGVVYIGAAILIIVIGLRGLKFIPATAPSIVVSALMLEFVLLIIYAMTVIYTKDEETPDHRAENVANGRLPTSTALLARIADHLESINPAARANTQSDSQNGKVDSAAAREMENLLRVFVDRQSDAVKRDED